MENKVIATSSFTALTLFMPAEVYTTHPMASLRLHLPSDSWGIHDISADLINL